MSNFLAIATVTATLRQILDDAVSKDVNGAIGDGGASQCAEQSVTQSGRQRLSLPRHA